MTEQLHMAQFQFQTAERKLEETELRFTNQLVKLEALLKQKDEMIEQLKNQREKNKNFQLIHELQAKLQKAENRINQLSRENIGDLSLRKLPSKARLSVLSLEHHPNLKLTSYHEKKTKLDSSLKANFEKLDKLLKRKESGEKVNGEKANGEKENGHDNGLENGKDKNDYDDELVLNITDDRKNRKEEDEKKKQQEINNIIQELYEHIHRIEEKNEDYQKELDKVQRGNTSLTKNLNIIRKQLTESENYKIQLINENDELKAIKEEADDMIEIEKTKNKRLEKKLTRIKLSSSVNDKETLESKLKLEELENELTDLQLELKHAEKVIKQEREKYETDIVGQKKLIEERDKRISDQQNKIETLAAKNKEYLEKYESYQKDHMFNEDQLKKQYQSNEISYLEKIKDLEGKLREIPNSISEERSQQDHFAPSINNSKYNGVGPLDMSFDNDFDMEAGGISQMEDQVFPLVANESVFNVDSDREIPHSKKNSIRPRNISESVLINRNKLNAGRKEGRKTELLKLLDQIAENNQEIQKLRNELLESREKNDSAILEERIANLEMEIKHLKRNNENDRIGFEKEKSLLEKNLNEIIEDFTDIKTKYASTEAEKDYLVMEYNRKVRNLEFQISLYEEQIIKFNQKVKRKLTYF